MFEWITKMMESTGYWGVALLMALENIFPPIPSELVMPLAGYTAERGEMRFWGAVAAGTIGSVLGALPWYYVAKWLGKERLKNWADKYGAWLTLSGEEIEKATQWFNDHGKSAVFFGRLIPGVRTLISVPAGFSDMSLTPFLMYSTLGTLIWTAGLAYLGKMLGENYEQVRQYLGPATYVIIGGMVLYLGYEIMEAKTRKQGKRKRK